MNAAIATHLNVSEAAIVRLEEWANVLFVIVRGLGARFVSKKVVKMQLPSFFINKYGHKVWAAAGARVEQMSDGFCPSYMANGTYCLVPGVEHERVATVEKAMEIALQAQALYGTKPKVSRSEGQKDRAFAASVGMMQTSTGQWVTADEWDEIEGAM